MGWKRASDFANKTNPGIPSLLECIIFTMKLEENINVTGLSKQRRCEIGYNGLILPFRARTDLKQEEAWDYLEVFASHQNSFVLQFHRECLFLYFTFIEKFLKTNQIELSFCVCNILMNIYILVDKFSVGISCLILRSIKWACQFWASLNFPRSGVLYGDSLAFNCVTININ